MAGKVSDEDRRLAFAANLVSAAAVNKLANRSSPADVEGLIVNFTRQVEHFGLMYFMAGLRLRANPNNETEMIMQDACARLVVAAHAALQIVTGELGLDAGELLRATAGGPSTLELCELVRPAAQATIALCENEAQQQTHVDSFARAFRAVIR